MSDTTTPLTCYLHVAQIGRWEAIARELLERMDAAGLYGQLNRLAIGWSGPGNPPAWLYDRGRIYHNGSTVPAGEVPTLRKLHADCVSDLDMGHVLYLHVKGASHPPGRSDQWRAFLAAGVIGRWRECVAKLDSGEFDAAGNEWYGPERAGQWADVWGLHGLDFAPHFAGNMWWSRADYVARLEPGPFHMRFDAEYRMIGTGNPRVWCPEFAGVDWYKG